MNEYAFRVGDREKDGAELRFKMGAMSRADALRAVRDAFSGNHEGVPVLKAEEIADGVGSVAVWVDPDRITECNVIEGPSDDAPRCPECGQATIEPTGEPCEVAERSMMLEDYFGDGSRYVRVGVHTTGWRCTNPECDAADTDPCVHD